jgi:hypothetical protein
VSGETNGIELFVSPLEPGLDFKEQVFKDGISGLSKTLKMQLILEDHKITLPLKEDHNIPGKYYAFVNPTVAGFYQANVLGNIGNTTVSLSMHPPKVLNQLIDGHTAVVGEVNDLKESIVILEQSNSQNSIGYVGIGLGIVALVIASIALIRSKK